MTTHHVAPHGSDRGPGTADAPWRTPQRAAGAAQPGDAITLHAGCYPGPLAITTPDTTWSGRGRVTLDGRWNGRSTATAAAVVSIKAVGTVIASLEIVNAPMHAIAVRHPAHTVLIQDCTITRPARDGIHAFGRTSGRTLVVLRCTVSHAGRVARLKPGLLGHGIRLRSGHGCNIAFSTVEDASGSGIFIDRDSRGVTVFRCTLRDNGGAAVWLGNTVDSDIDGNTLYLTRRPPSTRHARPDGILVADGIGGRPSRHITIRDNLIVHCETLLRLKTDRNRHAHATSLDAGSSIHHNTFVAGPWTRCVIGIDDNPRQPSRATFRDNVIDATHAPDAALITPQALAATAQALAAAPQALACSHNAWSRPPPPAWRGPGDIVGFRLAAWADGLPPDGVLNEADFAPPAGSPLVGRASDGAAIGALEPNP